MRELLCGFRHPAVDRPTHLMHMSCNSPCSFSDMPFLRNQSVLLHRACVGRSGKLTELIGLIWRRLQMASTSRSHRADAGLWKMLAVGILALLAFIWWDTYSATGARAALEHQGNVEMALESRAVCDKVGHTGRYDKIRRV